MHMTIRIIVDNREKELYECCQQKIESFTSISVECKQLSLGDVEIYNNDELLFVWERKTFPDLLASIKDGRYAEQSHRLENIYGKEKVVYLIEGILHQYTSQKQLIMSTITSIMFYKGFHVFRTVSVQDSAESILMCCNKISKNTNDKKDVYYKKEETTREYGSLVKKEKKDNINRENIAQIMLCQIPHISNTTAKAILEYTNNDLHELIELIRNSPEKLNTINTGGRKISKKVISQLIEHLGKTNPDQNI